MTKEEVKQWLRSQIDFSVKKQSKYNKDIFETCYNKNYLRALKLSKITGQPVNKDNFNSGVELFWVNTNLKDFWIYSIIRKYLNENYSIDHTEHCEIVKEVLNEYAEYKDYTWGVTL